MLVPFTLFFKNDVLSDIVEAIKRLKKMLR
jgi:hypothetical protein